MDNKVKYYATYISDGSKRELIHKGNSDGPAIACAHDAARVAVFCQLDADVFKGFRVYVEHVTREGEVVKVEPDIQTKKGGGVGYGNNYNTSIQPGCEECGNTHGDAHSANCSHRKES